MKHFASLFAALDGTTKTTAKIAALTQYFQSAPEADRVWIFANICLRASSAPGVGPPVRLPPLSMLQSTEPVFPGMVGVPYARKLSPPSFGMTIEKS